MVLLAESLTRLGYVEAPPAAPASQARQMIAGLLGSPPGPLAFADTFENPYSPSSLLTAYVDADGTDYWIDHPLRTVVKMGARPCADLPPCETRQELRHRVAALRTRAREVAAAARPGFPAEQCVLHPFESNLRRLLYFFRWERPLSAERGCVPVLQVGLHPDGSLASFLNTLAYG